MIPFKLHLDVTLPPSPPGMPDPVREPEAYLVWAKAQIPVRRAEIEALEAQASAPRAAPPNVDMLEAWRFVEHLRGLQQVDRPYRSDTPDPVFVVPPGTCLAGASIPEGERSLDQIVEAINAGSPSHTASCRGRELTLTARRSDVARQPTSETAGRALDDAYAPDDLVRVIDGESSGVYVVTRVGPRYTDMQAEPGLDVSPPGPTRQGYGRAKPAGYDRNRAVRARLGARSAR